MTGVSRSQPTSTTLQWRPHPRYYYAELHARHLRIGLAFLPTGWSGVKLCPTCNGTGRTTGASWGDAYCGGWGLRQYDGPATEEITDRVAGIGSRALKEIKQ